MKETAIPEGFIKMASALPGVDAIALVEALDTEPVVSLKLNRRKVRELTGMDYLTPEEASALTGYEGLEPVSWCRSGFYLPEGAGRPQFTLNPLLHAGGFYVQDASSMIYESLLERHLGNMAPGLVLDMCAAPGGKSTSMLNALPDGWKLIANEYTASRAGALRENISKWGYTGSTVTSADTSVFASAGPLFSIIAVDAPCSGEGMMRKEAVARTQWSPGLVQQCAALQREILGNAVEALLPGGLLIYSTCTFNTTENDDNLNWLIEEHGLELLEEPSRFMPHLTRGEGLFAAILRKPGGNLDGAPSAPNGKKAAKDAKRLQKVLSRCRILPDPSALGEVTDLSQLPKVELDLETALNYLRHQAIVLPGSTPKGPVIVTYKGAALGLAKNLGNRANNLYPKEWRIRNL